jgi:hypothetical protein
MQLLHCMGQKSSWKHFEGSHQAHMRRLHRNQSKHQCRQQKLKTCVGSISIIQVVVDYSHVVHCSQSEHRIVVLLKVVISLPA